VRAENAEAARSSCRLGLRYPVVPDESDAAVVPPCPYPGRRHARFSGRWAAGRAKSPGLRPRVGPVDGAFSSLTTSFPSRRTFVPSREASRLSTSFLPHTPNPVKIIVRNRERMGQKQSGPLPGARFTSTDWPSRRERFHSELPLLPPLPGAMLPRFRVGQVIGEGNERRRRAPRLHARASSARACSLHDPDPVEGMELGSHLATSHTSRCLAGE
jgi:hypothetical protein